MTSTSFAHKRRMPDDPASKDVLANVAPRAVAIREIKRWIEDGSLQRGQPLPAERELAKRLSVSKATVRRALVVLEEEGLLRTHAGRTRMVAERRPGGLLGRTVVVLAEQTIKPSHRQGGWLDALGRSVFAAAHASGFSALSFVGSDAELDAVIHDRPLGVIIPETYFRLVPPPELIQRLRAADLPFVTSGDEAAIADCDRVAFDHETGALELVRFLVARGRRSILQSLPMRDFAWSRARFAGYERGMREAGLHPLPPLRIPGIIFDDQDPGRMVAQQRSCVGFLLDRVQGEQGADAIMLHTDGEIFAVTGALRSLGCAERIDLVGFDDYWQDCWERQYMPDVRPLATVSKRHADQGLALVETLLARIAGSLPPAPQRVLIAPRLVVTGA